MLILNGPMGVKSQKYNAKIGNGNLSPELLRQLKLVSHLLILPWSLGRSQTSCNVYIMLIFFCSFSQYSPSSERYYYVYVKAWQELQNL